MTEHEITQNFRTERYEALNALRWSHFLSMGIPLKGRTVFEPGAGIGDHTEWLLNQGAKHVCVNEGRPGNFDIIRERFKADVRVSLIPGDLEVCLDSDRFKFSVDLIFCYGVYYHLNESCPDFHIMRSLASIGNMIALDYLTGDDAHIDYGYNNPSTSLSEKAFRPRRETLMDALKDIWGYAYEPVEQLKWVDPVVAENRLVAVASHSPLNNPNLNPWCP